MTSTEAASLAISAGAYQWTPTEEHTAGHAVPSSSTPSRSARFAMLTNHKVLKVSFSFSLTLKFSTAHFGAWASAQVLIERSNVLCGFVVIAEVNCVLVRETRCTF